MAWYEGICDDKVDSKKFTIIAAGVLVVIGLIVGLTCAFVIVYPPKASADDATLLHFALAGAAPTPTLSYNITLVLSLRNPNWYRGIHYDRLDAAFSFNGTRFDESATVPPFYHEPKKTATFHLTVGGVNKGVKLGSAGVWEFQQDNVTSKFDVEARLDTVMRYKGRKTRCPLVVICPLKLQLVDPEVAATAFQRTSCTVLKAKKSGC